MAPVCINVMHNRNEDYVTDDPTISVAQSMVKIENYRRKSLLNEMPLVCPKGYTINPVLGFCTDIDECSQTEDQKCQQICVNSPGSYHCLCHPGFKLQNDEYTCKREELFNRCPLKCVNGGTCVDGKCLCPDGLQGDLCQKDIDECTKNKNVCEYQCKNTFGGYNCQCPEGFVPNVDMETCTAISCVPECTNGGRCINGKCLCPAGFKGVSCSEDRNECREGLAGCEYMCRNTYGRYVCLCPPRSLLKPDKHSCTFSRLCLHKCRNGGTCVKGKCICPSGFSGRTCRIDRNECSVGESECSYGCFNTYGSYRCYCPKNMSLSADMKTCQDTIVQTSFVLTTQFFEKATTTTTTTKVTFTTTTLPTTVETTTVDLSKESDIRKIAETLLNNFDLLPKDDTTNKRRKDIVVTGNHSESYLMTINQNIMNSMLADLKSRKRVLNSEVEKPSNRFISMYTDLPCFYKGSVLKSGTEFSGDQYNCTQCNCLKGELRCLTQSCSETACEKPIHGQCCNRCPDDCIFDKKVRKAGQYFSPKNDLCKICNCDAGMVTCRDAPCPTLDCAVEHQFLPPEECCAQCIMVKKEISSKVMNINGCKHRNIIYDIRDSWVDPLDDCTICECKGKENIECAGLDCLKELCDNVLVKRCCSVCSDCLVDGQYLMSGSKIARDGGKKCEECTCESGELICDARPCDDNNCNVRIQEKTYWHKHGDLFKLPNDPCVQCVCQNGEMSCFANTCPTSCQHGVKEANECCSNCRDCKYEEQVYKNQHQFKIRRKCQVCRCVNGNVSCGNDPDCH